MNSYRVGIYISGQPGVRWLTVNANEADHAKVLVDLACQLRGVVLCYDRIA